MVEAQRGFDREGMIYCGDDPNKDGRLAMASGVPFGLFDPTGKKQLPEEVTAVIRFEDWGTVASRLEMNISTLKRGSYRRYSDKTREGSTRAFPVHFYFSRLD